MCGRATDWHVSARFQPLPVSLKIDLNLVVEDKQVAIVAANNGFRRDSLYLLSDHADIGFVTTVVAKAIKADAVAKAAE